MKKNELSFNKMLFLKVVSCIFSAEEQKRKLWELN